MTLEEQIRCVEREIELRRRVYPRLTARGSLKPEQAEHQIKAMQAVRETLLKLSETSSSPG